MIDLVFDNSTCKMGPPTLPCRQLTPITTRKQPTKKSNSNNKNNRKTRKSLSFSKYDEVYEIPHINDMPESQIRDCYMSPEESKAIRMECRDLLSELDDECNIFMEEEGYRHLSKLDMYRGLEKHTKTQSRRIESLQDKVYDVVFALQQYGWGDDDGDDMIDMSAIIAKKYKEMTRCNALDAQRSGIHDAKAVAVKYNQRNRNYFI